MKKNLVLMLSVLLFLLALTACGKDALSDPSWDSIQKKGSIIVGVTDQNLPLTFRNSSGKMTGFDIETATEVCRRLNLKVELMAIAPDDMQKSLESGVIDCYWSGLTLTKKEVDDAYEATAPYIRNDDIFLIPENSAIQNIAHLSGKRLGVMAGSTGERALEMATQLQSSLTAVEKYNDLQSAFSAFNAGSVDAVVMSEATARYYMNLNPDRYRILQKESGKQPEPLSIQSCVVAVRQEEHSLRRKLESAISSMDKDGKMKEISERWFGTDISIAVK